CLALSFTICVSARKLARKNAKSIRKEPSRERDDIPRNACGARSPARPHPTLQLQSAHGSLACRAFLYLFTADWSRLLVPVAILACSVARRRPGLAHASSLDRPALLYRRCTNVRNVGFANGLYRYGSRLV